MTPALSKSHTVAILLAQVCIANIELAKASRGTAKTDNPLYRIVEEQRDTIVSLIESVQNDLEVRATHDKEG